MQNSLTPVGNLLATVSVCILISLDYKAVVLFFGDGFLSITVYVET